VLKDLPRDIGLHKENVEITVWFVLAAVLLVFAGVGLALWWNRPATPQAVTGGSLDHGKSIQRSVRRQT